jgi:TP901 family phage tail tape measure protein
MAMEASEVAVRVRLLGGSAFEKEATGVSRSVEGIGAAGKKADLVPLTSGATKAHNAISTLGSKVEKFGGVMMGMGRSLAPASAGIAALGYYAVKAQSQFQSSMMLLYSQAGLPRKNIQALTKDVLTLSKAVGQSPNTLAQGLFPIISSGIHNTNKAMSVLKTSGIMAAIGKDTVNNTAEALTSVMNTGFKASPMKIAAMVESAIGAGKMHMPDVTASLGTAILPLAKMTGGGGSLPQILAAMAALAREGVSPESAMSRMRLSLTSVTSPTTMGQKALKQMGLGKFALANDLRTPGHLVAMLQDLQEHTSTMGADKRNNLIAQIFGKSRGIGNIGALLNALPMIESISKGIISASPGLVTSHFQGTQSTNAFKMQQVKAELDKEMIALGQAISKYLLPDVVKLIPFLTKMVSGFSKLPPGVQKAVILFGAFTVLASPFLMVFGGVFKAIGTLGRGLGWLLGKTRILGTAEEVAAGKSGLGGFMGGLRRAIPLLLAFSVAIAALPAVIKAIHHQYNLDKHAIQNKPGARSKLLQNTMSNMSHGGTLGQINARSVPSKVVGFLGGLFSGLASGGIVQGAGMTLVGEQGPELLTLPRGSSVTPLPGNHLTDLRAQFGEGTGNINVTVQNVLDGKVISQTVAKINRREQNRK